VRHLQVLTSQAFESESYAEQAKSYQGWATANGTGTPRTWFRDALEQRGYDVRAFADWATAASLAAPPDEAVPVLLKALRDREFYIQRNASFLLNLRMGSGAPDEISYATSAEEAEAAIRAYHEWWASYRKAEEAKRNG
jgi:hypothetical protein